MARFKFENPHFAGVLLGLQKALEKRPVKHEISLKNLELNKLTIQELQLIFKCIPAEVSTFDLSNNNLGEKTDADLKILFNVSLKNFRRVTLINNGLDEARIKNLDLNNPGAIVLKTPRIFTTCRANLLSHVDKNVEPESAEPKLTDSSIQQLR